jgi:DNA-binding SARP family transcriptional activator
MLTVRLLGPPELLLDQRSLTALRRKNRALVYYLAAHAQALTRDHLLTLFWPDYERRAAQRILRAMLHELRKQLGATLLADDDRLGLAPDTWVDARIFRASLASSGSDLAALASTLELHRGDFLDDFSLPDAPAFNDWVAAERERYRSLMIRGLTSLSQLHEGGGKYIAALAALSRALAFDPLQEDLQRSAIRLHYLNGDRAGAIRRYEMLRRLLDEEMGVPPMAETRALYDAIITDRLPIPGPPPTVTVPPEPAVQPRQTQAALLPFTGRGAELRTLKALAPAGKLILIEGEAGIGKTRLVEEYTAVHQPALRHDQQRPALVLRGIAYESEQGFAYQPVIDAVRSLFHDPEWTALCARLSLAQFWLAEVARLIPDLTLFFPNLVPASEPADESRLWESLRQLLMHLARQHPILLVLDDLQWADSSTVGLLGYLVRRAASPSLMLLGAARPIGAHSKLAMLLQTLSHEDRLARLELSALTTTEIVAISQRFSPADGRQLSEWLIHQSEGNPYFLTELIRYALDSRLLAPDGAFDTAALSWSPILPPTIRNLILSRLVRLSEDARRVLELAAVIGYEFDFAILAQTAALAESALLDTLDELRAAALITSSPDERYMFDHSLTMEVVYRDIGEARYRSLHRHIAERLEQMHGDQPDTVAGLIAYHFARGNAPQRAAPYAFRAGNHAAGLAAWSEAIAFFEQALSAETDDARRIAIYMALGDSHFHYGNLARATEHFRAAITLAQSCGDLSDLEAAHLALNQTLLPQGRWLEASAQGEALGRSGPPELAACAEFMWGSGLALESAHPAEAEYHLREAAKLLARQSGYTSLVKPAQITYLLANVLGQQGNNTGAAAAYLDVLRLVHEDQTQLDLHRHIFLYNNLAYQLHLLNDPSAAEYAEAGIKLANEKGSHSHLTYLLSTSGEIALARNDLESAERLFDEGLALAQRIPIPERIAGLSANLGLVARARGQTELAKERFLEALARAEALGGHHMVASVQLWLAPLLPADDARAMLSKARALIEGGGFQRLYTELTRLERQLFPDELTPI